MFNEKISIKCPSLRRINGEHSCSYEVLENLSTRGAWVFFRVLRNLLRDHDNIYKMKFALRKHF